MTSVIGGCGQNSHVLSARKCPGIPFRKVGNYHLNRFLSASEWSSLRSLIISLKKALPADFTLIMLLFSSSWKAVFALLIFMESSFQVLLTKLLTSTCTFTFQNLPAHYVVGIRYLALVRNTVKICKSWLLPHITIQSLHQL